MRLIDADALISKIEEHMPLSWTDSESELQAVLDYHAYLTTISTAATIDAVPVVRGEWVLLGENEHDYETSLEERCSLCGRYVYRYDTQPQDNYCPNCGAKMESEAR